MTPLSPSRGPAQRLGREPPPESSPVPHLPDRFQLAPMLAKTDECLTLLRTIRYPAAPERAAYPACAWGRGIRMDSGRVAHRGPTSQKAAPALLNRELSS